MMAWQDRQDRRVELANEAGLEIWRWLEDAKENNYSMIVTG